MPCWIPVDQLKRSGIVKKPLIEGQAPASFACGHNRVATGERVENPERPGPDVRPDTKWVPGKLHPVHRHSIVSGRHACRLVLIVQLRMPAANPEGAKVEP